MLKKLTVLFLLTFLISTGSLFSQNAGKICGHVKDIDTGKALICVNIMIKSTYIGAATDTKGNFCIEKVPVGTFELSASIIGYKTVIKSGIVVTKGSTTELNFEMQSEPINLNKVTVTATRGYNLVTDVPVSTAIITSAELAQRASQNVGEALEATGGVYIKSYGDLAGMKSISIRGSADSQVLVLIDGQRLNNSQNSSVDFSAIPIDAVEKIEVVKGGHSALYGANAVGGVVNIITKSAIHNKKFSADIKSTFGSLGTQIYSINGSQNIGNLNYYLSLKNVTSDGDFKFEDNTGEEKKLDNNDIKSNHMFFKLNYNISLNSYLTFSTQLNEIKKGLHGTISYHTPNRRMTENTNLYNLSFNGNILSRLHLRTNTYYHRTDDKIDDPDSWDTPHSRHKNKAYGLELQNRFILNKNIVLTSGYDYRNDKLESTQLDEQKRNTHSVYLQGELETNLNNFPLINKINFIPAVRYDSYSDMGSETSPKLGLAISRKGTVTTSFRSNIGKSFRSPTFNDLYWPEDMWSVGNPDLKPETGINYDAGTILQYSKDNFSTNFEFTYFVSNLEDLIIWAPRPDFKWMPQNVDKSETKGIETKLDFLIFNNLIKLNIAHTYMEAKNNSDDSQDKGKFIIYRPKHKFDLGFAVNYQIFVLNLMYRYVDKSFTTSDNSNSIPTYRVYDVSASATPSLFGLKILAKFDVLNLSDKRFIIVNDHPMPGRQIRFTIGLRY